MAVSRSCWWPSLILLLPLSPPPAPADGRLGILLLLLPLLLPGRPHKLQPRGRAGPSRLSFLFSYFLPSLRLLLARTSVRAQPGPRPAPLCPRLGAPRSCGRRSPSPPVSRGDLAKKAPLRAPEPYTHCWMLSPAMKTREPAFILLQLEYKRTAHASSSTTQPRTPHLLRAAQDPGVSSLPGCPGSMTLRPSTEILGLPFLERSFFIPLFIPLYLTNTMFAPNKYGFINLKQPCGHQLVCS